MKFLRILSFLTIITLQVTAYAQYKTPRPLFDPTFGNDGGGGIIIQSQEAQEKVTGHLDTHGFIDASDRPAAVDYLLERIALRQKEADLHLRGDSLEELGFTTLDPGVETAYDVNEISYELLEQRPSSVAYLLPSNVRVRRVFTKTQFGRLMIEEGIGATELFGVNLEIGGYPAKIVTAKQQGEGWSTTIIATDGRKVFLIQSAGRRLNDKLINDLIYFTGDLVAVK